MARSLDRPRRVDSKRRGECDGGGNIWWRDKISAQHFIEISDAEAVELLFAALSEHE